MHLPRARTLSARLSVMHWLRLIERHGSLVRAFTGEAVTIQHLHYPAGDLVDRVSGTQCYYHCHRGDGEHGHLHLFRRARQNRPLTHLIGISLDPQGLPLAFFTVNQWVCNDRWLPACETLRLLDGVSLSRANCDPHLGGWLVYFLRFYRPSLDRLLQQRDQALRQSSLGIQRARDRRRLEIPSQCWINWVDDLVASEASFSSVG